MNHKIRQGIVILVFIQLLTACKNQNQQQNTTSVYIQKVDSVMQIAFERNLFNGNVLIAKKDSILYERSFGFYNTSKSKNLDNRAIFNIGSIAKEFNGVAIMKLVELGKLSLEDTLDSFGFSLPQWSEKIRLKHLINYAGGLPKMANYGFGITHDSIAFQRIRAIDKLLFEPGSNFNYNNYSVFLQRRIVEKVSGKTFQEFVMEHLVAPAGMTNAVFDPTPTHPNRTSCYDIEGTACPEMEFISGWLWVTANDLHKWIDAMNNNRIISKKSFEFALRNPFASGMTSSLGEYFKDQDLQRHNGTSLKYRSVMLNDFNKETTIILLDNNEGFALELGHVAHHILLNQKFELPKKSVFQKLRKTFIEDVDKGIAAYHMLKKTKAEQYTFENPIEINRLGYAVLRAGKPKQAIATFEFGIETFPKDANLYDSLGEVLLEEKNYEDALLNYKKAIALGGTNGNAKTMVGKIQELLN